MQLEIERKIITRLVIRQADLEKEELVIEFVFHFIFILELILVSFFEIFGQHNVTIFSDSNHTLNDS